MSVFSDAWAQASAQIDAIFGEAWTYQPRALVAGKWGADAARPAVACIGALDAPAVFSEPLGKRVAANTVAQHATTHALLDIASDALPYAPREKDRVLRSADRALYEVTGVLQDNFARIGLRVARLGAAS